MIVGGVDAWRSWAGRLVVLDGRPYGQQTLRVDPPERSPEVSATALARGRLGHDRVSQRTQWPSGAASAADGHYRPDAWPPRGQHGPPRRLRCADGAGCREVKRDG